MFLRSLTVNAPVIAQPQEQLWLFPNARKLKRVLVYVYNHLLVRYKAFK